MNFTCPYCGRDTTITEPNKYSNWGKIYIERSTYGEVGFGIACITCPNKECHKLSLEVHLTKAILANGSHKESTEIQSWSLLPESAAKVLPDYIPSVIAEDYYEACRIRDLSPKASATLSRRCLQGMIRDFHRIVKSRLIEEISALEGIVDQDVWDSIDAVRKVGNIGAHMEKDINVIVDVEPKEAQLLISLNEQLFEDWYTTREARRKRTQDLKALAEKKNTPEPTDVHQVITEVSD